MAVARVVSAHSVICGIGRHAGPARWCGIKHAFDVLTGKPTRTPTKRRDGPVRVLTRASERSRRVIDVCRGSRSGASSDRCSRAPSAGSGPRHPEPVILVLNPSRSRRGVDFERSGCAVRGAKRAPFRATSSRVLVSSRVKSVSQRAATRARQHSDLRLRALNSVRAEGVEPSRPRTPGPKPGASAIPPRSRHGER